MAHLLYDYTPILGKPKPQTSILEIHPMGVGILGRSYILTPTSTRLQFRSSCMKASLQGATMTLFY
jgi:hypothetical protein